MIKQTELKGYKNAKRAVVINEDKNNKQRYSKMRELHNSKTQGEWDTYWLTKKETSRLIFDLIATFYRKIIIKRALNHFIEKYFKSAALLLHAGCGSGQVDTGISDKIDILALDISIPALNIYKKIHKNSCRVINGDISRIPVKNEILDGIYNLGTMEHFSEDEIHKILIEFYRVLKPNGKMVLFWPPKYGLSIIFLKAVHYMFNNIFRKNIKLHPDEITHIRSKRQAKAIFAKANFAVVEYYFGVRDFFTYAVIVSKKGRDNLSYST